MWRVREFFHEPRAFFLCSLCVGLASAQTPSIASRLAKWKNVDMPFHTAGLTDGERQMVDKLVEACRLLDDVYWRQSDLDGLKLYKSSTDPALKSCSRSWAAAGI